MPSSTTYRARWVLPVSAAPIEDGEVVVEADRIAAVRPRPRHDRAGGDAVDLGEAVLLPGLVNAHTHLDYTVMRGLIEDLPFLPWVRELNARKAALDDGDWVASATAGAAEAVAGGVTTIADCTDSGAALVGAKTLGLRGIVYQEVFGIDEAVPARAIVDVLDARVRELQRAADGTRLSVGVSPHSPYTVRPDLFRALAPYVAERNLPTCIHAAESPAEAELTRQGTGPIADMLARRGIDWPAPGLTPVAYLDSVGAITERTLLVHGIQLSVADCDVVRARGAAWVHCPKSNAKLGNGIGSLGLWRRSGPREAPRLGLGSDSVASNNTMDLFEEMRFAVLVQRARGRRIEAMTARDALEAATIGGARALGLEALVGSLDVGKQADLIAVRLDGHAVAPCYDPYNALVYAASARDVALTVVAGDALYRDGRYLRAGGGAWRDRFRVAAEKMRAWQRPEGPL